MTSHRIVSRIGWLSLMFAGLAALWVAMSPAALGQSPSIDGGTWQFGANSTGNVVEIKYSGIPAAGLGAADISVAFDSTVLSVAGCSTGDLQGACNPNSPGGPVRAAGFAAPAITTQPVTIATLTVSCLGAAVSSSALTITVNELIDGTVGGEAISASISNGIVTCGVAGTDRLWADANCDGEVNPIDSLGVLRSDAGLFVTQQPGCPLVGSTVTVFD